MYLGAIKIFSVYSMYHNTVSLRIEIISLKKIEKSYGLASIIPHVMCKLKHLRWGAVSSVILPSHTISASAGTKSRDRTPTTNFRSFWARNQRERRKLPDHIQRQCNSNRDIPQWPVFFCSAQAISRTSVWYCAKGFLGILPTVRHKGGLCKRRKLTVDEESLFNVNLSNHLHGCGINSSASWGVWRERWQIHWAIVSNWMQHLGKVPCMKTGATQLGVGQSKAEDRLTSACTRDCTEALGQAAEGNAHGTIPGGI